MIGKAVRIALSFCASLDVCGAGPVAGEVAFADGRAASTEDAPHILPSE